MKPTDLQLYKHLIFVYGTLKQGQPNHHVMRSLRALYIGKACTLDKFPLIVGTRAKLPFLLYHPGHGQHVIGELYAVGDEMLKLLDEFEEHPIIYEREPVSIEYKICNRKLGEAWNNIKEHSMPCGEHWKATALVYFFKAFPADQLHRRSLLEEYDAAKHDAYDNEADEFLSSSHVVEHLLSDA